MRFVRFPLVLLVFSSIFVFSQGWNCGTITTAGDINIIKQILSGITKKYDYTTLPCINKTLSLTVYIVRDSLGKTNIDKSIIQEAVDSLNNKFKPICLSFKICEFIEIHNFQYDTISKDKYEYKEVITKYYKPNTINIYFVKEIITPNSVCGFAPYPPSKDYIFLKKKCIIDESINNKFITFQHMMGHYLGLLHTFEVPLGFTDQSDCSTTGDLICDTEADPNAGFTDCGYASTIKDAHGDFYLIPTDNFMSYYVTCMCRFSNDQYRLMSEIYFKMRNYLW
jgi:hypothetical protein